MNQDAKQNQGDATGAGSAGDASKAVNDDPAKANVDSGKKQALEEMLKQAQMGDISKETQAELNRPLVDPEEMPKEDEEFLRMVVGLIESGKLDLSQKASLMNEAVYAELKPSAKATAEIDSLNLLNTLRGIYKLYQNKQTDTYQFRSQLKQFRLTKERMEAEAGDVFII